jgi:hypothetical protein
MNKEVAQNIENLTIRGGKVVSAIPRETTIYDVIESEQRVISLSAEEIISAVTDSP